MAMNRAVRSLCRAPVKRIVLCLPLRQCERTAKSDRVRLGWAIRQRFKGSERVDHKFKAVIGRGHAQQVLQYPLVDLERRLQEPSAGNFDQAPVAQRPHPAQRAPMRFFQHRRCQAERRDGKLRLEPRQHRLKPLVEHCAAHKSRMSISKALSPKSSRSRATGSHSSGVAIARQDAHRAPDCDRPLQSAPTADTPGLARPTTAAGSPARLRIRALAGQHHVTFTWGSHWPNVELAELVSCVNKLWAPSI